ncbi:MAPEG family protein [Vreelandella malpeensis]|uniref:Microsomal glutathione S-transferase 1 n=1 Tax=Vreelandella malpeensis TaxID=1172368 RepID=A0ABS8DV77_9GAMM|nr:MAPEG family protein [Halomonas malpeensis]MCB8890246.1 MAPEG family protein [Halomonas malpeensis]
MDDAVYWYAVAAVLLFVKMWATSLYQGYHRITKMTFKTPEDARMAGKEPASEELPQVQQAAKAWSNDLENIPIFLGLGVAYVMVGASPAFAGWLFMLFTAARYAHTLAYLVRLQPWRTLAYGVGVLCMIAMCALICVAIF